MGEGEPVALATGGRPETSGDQIRSASLVMAIAAGTLSFCVVQACLIMAFADPATDLHGDSGFAALGLCIVSPALALINVCLCLPLLWVADRFAEAATSRERWKVGLHRPGLLFSSFAFIACADTFSCVPQRSSVFAGHSFITNMMAVPLVVHDGPWPYIVAAISAAAVYHCIARWMVGAAPA